MTLTLDDTLYIKFTSLIYKKTGLYYEVQKKYFVEKRIEKRIMELSIDSYKEYYQLIKYSTDEKEFNQLINDLTVNETYFFRDFPQLQNFAEEVLPIYCKKKKRKKDLKLRIWSAACSTGEEPYTLAIILLEMLDLTAEWDITIMATDINDEVLEKANIGLYDLRSVKEVPEEYMYKYFTVNNNKYHVNLKLKKYIKFKKLNLYNDQEISNIQGCDFIFCRNCLIYFDDVSRKKVVENMYHCLNKSGYIFLGHSESIGRITPIYDVKKIGDTLVYTKP